MTPKMLFLKPKTENKKTENVLLLLQRHFPDLDLSAAAVSLAEKEPKNQREISAKFPRQTDSCTDNLLQNQIDNQSEKSLAKNSLVGPESEAPPGVAEAPDPSSLIPDPCPDETAARADELFEISHGYKRHNPPKHIPNRRRDEDFRSTSIFGDPKKYSAKIPPPKCCPVNNIWI